MDESSKRTGVHQKSMKNFECRGSHFDNITSTTHYPATCYPLIHTLRKPKNFTIEPSFDATMPSISIFSVYVQYLCHFMFTEVYNGRTKCLLSVLLLLKSKWIKSCDWNFSLRPRKTTTKQTRFSCCGTFAVEKDSC
ncbi:hypothetical protein OUZ56_028547 [Daphnia magna]|uniref:Uncharacterized protein n=1 Tax=Daphnia magna TaxID=35525 RepID=A0ABR0B470_9CRUS|nr:hypothetical protein OUZ56_028547 [Daphnia magna]